MLSEFFIYRPIASTVVSIVIVMGGLVALGTLPISQYPDITPPTVKVSTVYPGANATTVAQTVAQPIEQEVNGVENMLYMSSTSANDGSYNLTVTFGVGTDLDMASILVQNRVATAMAKLPQDVTRQGVTTKKQSPQILLMVCLTSNKEEHDDLFLGNYATAYIKDELARISGVGDVMVFGASDYSMRIWLNPNQLKERKLTTDDVVQAIREQNVQVAAGIIGQEPAPQGTAFQFTINTQGRLRNAEEFEDIIIKTGDNGRVVRVRDVARVELGSKTYTLRGESSGQPSANIAIFQLPGANALDVAKQIRKTMERLKPSFPAGLKYDIPFDTTLFVEASINEVYVTLFQAALLVFITIFVFLQDWRATIIPAIAIPVSLIGTFAVMAGIGFSINMLTLFGLVLAIGIVVDDAIVVVENCSRLMDEHEIGPREAAVQTMHEVTGPVIATTAVLLAVFVPSAFLPGITGQLYRQFALTIATATVFSSVNALTMTPAMCALFLRPTKEVKKSYITRILNPFLFLPFNFVFNGSEKGYSWVVRRSLRMAFVVMLLFVGLSFSGTWGLGTIPTGFLPVEDQGYFMASVQLPNAASLQRTQEVVDEISGILKETEGVDSWVTLTGYSLIDGTNTSNTATFWIIMKPWEERSKGLSQDVIIGKLRKRFYQISEANIFAFIPPAISGLGVSGGFQMQILAKGGQKNELSELGKVTREMVQAGNSQSGLRALNTTFQANVPQLYAEVNRTQAKTMNVPLSNIFGTLQAYLGSAYVNDFNKLNRTYQVTIQADAMYRVAPEDLLQLDVRNTDGQMVPMSAMVSVERDFGPQIITRYNLYPTASITGEASPGFSSGEALTMMEEMAKDRLPPNMGFDWTGMAYQEKQLSNAPTFSLGNSTFVFALAVILVFLVLAFQYESWTSPAAVIFAVPLALVGVVIALLARGMDNNVYTQIGLILLIALASKNAILIVEFARELRSKGDRTIAESAAEAARLRFRPILMTSFASLLGFLPLVIATGAGAASRQAIGTVVVGGMAAATFMTVLFVPVFFLMFQGMAELGRKKTATKENSTPPNDDGNRSKETQIMETIPEQTNDKQKDA